MKLSTDGVTYEDLERLATQPTRSKPKALRLQEIAIAPAVFQFRISAHEDREANPKDEERLLREMVRSLQLREEPLPALLMIALGNQAFVVDGHHRLQAYYTAKWDSPVPVQWFEGSLREARMEAMRANRDNKLRMTSQSRFQAAWTFMRERRLYPERKMTWDGIIDVTGVSRGLLSAMHAVLEQHGEEALREEHWWRARRLGQPEFLGHPENVEEWLWKDALVKLEHLQKGPHLGKQIESTAIALEELGIKSALIQEWLGDAADALVESIRDEEGDEAALRAQEALSWAFGGPSDLSL